MPLNAHISLTSINSNARDLERTALLILHRDIPTTRHIILDTERHPSQARITAATLHELSHNPKTQVRNRLSDIDLSVILVFVLDLELSLV